MNHLTPAENALRNQSAAAIIGGQFDPNEVLLPYQKRWIADTSPLKIAEKSRRTGLTWAEAADAALNGSMAASAGGCDTFYVLSPVPHLESGINWHTKAESYRKLIATELSNTILPDLENQVVTSRIQTPQDFQDRLSSFRGAAFGLEPTLTQSAWFRPHNQSEDVKGLYFVGAGTHPGAGLPGVLSSARVLDALVPDAHALVKS